MKHECAYCEFCYSVETGNGVCRKTEETIPDIYERRDCKLFRKPEFISTEEWQAAIDPHYGRRWD